MITVTARQLSDTAAGIAWTTDDVDPSGWTVRRSVNAGTIQTIATLPQPPARAFYDSLSPAAPGDTVLYRIVNNTSSASGEVTITWADMDTEPTFGPVDFLRTDIRYTTLALVKGRLGIPAGDTARDAEMTSVIIAAESAIDAHLGRSFPDVGLNPDIPGVPEAVRSVATQVAVRVWKEADRAGTSAGSDDWFGTIDIAGATAHAVDRNPALVGLHATFGVA